MRLLVLLSIVALGIGGFRGQDAFGAPFGNEPGAKLQPNAGIAEEVTAVTVSPNGRLALSGNGKHTLRFWDMASGRQLRSVGVDTGGHDIYSVAFSPDSTLALSAAGKTLRLWEVASGRELRSFTGHTKYVQAVAFSPDGTLALSGDYDGKLKLWDVASGRELRSFPSDATEVASVAFSPDGRFALSGNRALPEYRDLNTLILWEVASGRELRRFTGHAKALTSVAFSPDGTLALSGSDDKTLKLWEVASGRELRSFTGHKDNVSSVAFSPDGRFVLSGSNDSTLKLWEASSGRELRSFASGREFNSFTGHASNVRSVAFSPDGKRIISGGADGTMRIWDAQTGEELAAMMVTRSDVQCTWTPKGFFIASQRDAGHSLVISRGITIESISQVYQSLYNPDLVRETLAGDPDGEVKRAAEAINIDKVFDSGPAPQVEIASHPLVNYKSDADLVTVTARIMDRGKGVGRIEWRLNGITAGVMSAPKGAGATYEVSQQLALDAGENAIEVIAYEGRNLLASPPARTTIVYNGPANATKPKLYILAIGINKYVDQGGHYGQFRPLRGSVPDAKAFSAEMEKAAAGQYENVRVTLALDEDATLRKLDEAVTKIAAEIGPRDTFVLYAAAHGYSLGGNYYMIPQDYQGGGDPQALKTRAVNQERIQEWLASRIKAKRAVILLDTCESGTLTGGYAKSRTEGPVSEAAVGRLHEATGRPVITAAAPGKSAYENYKGHGVFTYALMEALHKGDTNNNGMIEVTELAEHVERRVPELFAELKQSGWVVKGLAAARGDGKDAQTAHFGSTGEDFSLVTRLP
jgi:WD40 repeat protein/uncharacterized caspase-like protein